jgi:hypothetical protein
MRRPRPRPSARGDAAAPSIRSGSARRPAVAVARATAAGTVEQHQPLTVDGSSVADIAAQRVTFAVRDPASPGSDYACSGIGRHHVRSATATLDSPLRADGASWGHREVPTTQASAHQRASPSSTPHRAPANTWSCSAKGAAVMARRSCDNTGAPVPRDAGRDRRVRCRRQGAAEKLGVTVGGDWPIGPVWRSRMPPRCCSSASSSSRSSSLATSSGKSNSIGSRRRPERRRSTSSTTPTASPGCRPGAAGGPASTGLGGRGRMIVAGGRRRMGFDIWPLRRRDARHSRTHEQEAQMAGRTVAVRLEARISGHHAAGPQDGHEALTVPPSPPSRRF